MNVLYDKDVATDLLRGKTIAIIGYGSQGHAHALNLRDSGFSVVVGARPDGTARSAAAAEHFPMVDIAEAALEADVLMLLTPDEVQPDVYARHIAPELRPGAYVGFAHGLAVHSRRLVPRDDLNVFLVAPKGPGRQLRQRYTVGGGLAGLVAVHQDPAGDCRDVALAYAAGIGCGRVGILETTFREETETDLFSEQVVLCGGLVELIHTAYETLVEAGYTPESAYFECLHEVKLIADLIFERGISGMREAISNTAAYGGLTRGKRVIGAPARQAMRKILSEIQSGAFANEWFDEYATGTPTLHALAHAESEHAIEAVGQRLRTLMAGGDGNRKSRDGEQRADSPPQ